MNREGARVGVEETEGVELRGATRAFVGWQRGRYGLLRGWGKRVLDGETPSLLLGWTSARASRARPAPSLACFPVCDLLRISLKSIRRIRNTKCTLARRN